MHPITAKTDPVLTALAHTWMQVAYAVAASCNLPTPASAFPKLLYACVQGHLTFRLMLCCVLVVMSIGGRSAVQPSSYTVMQRNTVL